MRSQNNHLSLFLKSALFGLIYLSCVVPKGSSLSYDKFYVHREESVPIYRATNTPHMRFLDYSLLRDLLTSCEFNLIGIITDDNLNQGALKVVIVGEPQFPVSTSITSETNEHRGKKRKRSLHQPCLIEKSGLVQIPGKEYSFVRTIGFTNSKVLAFEPYHWIFWRPDALENIKKREETVELSEFETSIKEKLSKFDYDLEKDEFIYCLKLNINCFFDSLKTGIQSHKDPENYDGLFYPEGLKQIFNTYKDSFPRERAEYRLSYLNPQYLVTPTHDRMNIEKVEKIVKEDADAV